jgi:AraC-like DNA-binding protein
VRGNHNLTIGPSPDITFSRTGPTKRGNIESHATTVERLEHWRTNNADRPAYLIEVCAALGVSERTLRQACHEVLGTTPARYLWLCRMNLARAALLRADPRTTTVATIAMDCGFWELGRFSGTYRNLFGELPKTTLRRFSSEDGDVTVNLPLARTQAYALTLTDNTGSLSSFVRIAAGDTVRTNGSAGATSAGAFRPFPSRVLDAATFFVGNRPSENCDQARSRVRAETVENGFVTGDIC